MKPWAVSLKVILAEETVPEWSVCKMKTMFKLLLLAVVAFVAAGTASAGTFASAVGDINGDGVVNVLDIQAAIAQALQTAPGSALADVDGNSMVDIGDVQNLINTSLGTGGLVQRVKGVLSAPADLLLAGITLAAVSQDGDQVVATVDPDTGAFNIKLPVRKTWSFVFATVPDANGDQQTGTVQFTIAGTVSTVLPLADLSQCDVLDLGTLTFAPVITVATDIRDLLAHINKQDLLADADGNGIPDFLDRLIDQAAKLPVFDCNATTGVKMTMPISLPCLDIAAIKSLIKDCVANDIATVTDVSLVDANGNHIPDFLEPFFACLLDGVKTWLQQNNISVPDQMMNFMMSTMSQHLPELLGGLHMPRLMDTQGDGIPDHIRFGVGHMHIPPVADVNGDGIPDFLQHRPHHGNGEGEGEPSSEGEVEVQTATVPNLVGMTLDDAKTAVAAAGFPLGPVGHAFSDTVPVDQVMAQRPEADKIVPLNAQICLLVSAGPAPAPVAVPDVVGMTQTDAQSAIVAAGFVVGLVKEQTDATVPQGQVIRQFPAAGTMVPPGAPVNFLVSSGPGTATP